MGYAKAKSELVFLVLGMMVDGYTMLIFVKILSNSSRLNRNGNCCFNTRGLFAWDDRAPRNATHRAIKTSDMDLHFQGDI